MIAAWPKVHDEFETVRRMAAGASIARFGDGELKMIFGAGYSREKPNLQLSTELFDVLCSKAPTMLVGIPTLDPRGPKYENWLRHEERFRRVLPGKREFYSAFITRPDSSPWIRTREFLDLMLSCWRDKHVALVCEKDSKLPGVLRATAGQVTHLSCPSSAAYARIAHLALAVRKTGADLAVLSCGPTATCLARRLHDREIQALDLGSSGAFLAGLLAEARGRAG